MSLPLYLTIILDIVILIGILFLIWLLVPTFFRYVVAKNFDGSYEPKTDQILVPSILPTQDKKPIVEINSQSHEYTIKFGEGRSFSHGRVAVNYKGTRYSSDGTLQFVDQITSKIKTELGEATKITLNWQIPATDIQFKTSFVQYADNDYLQFMIESDKSITDIAHEDRNFPAISFPWFENRSFNQRIFTYRDGIFCPPMRDFTLVFSPVLFFDDAKNTVLLSALDNFVTNGIIKKSEKNQPIYEIACGPSNEVKMLAEKQVYNYFMVFHTGINATFKYWGDLLRKYYKSIPKDRYQDVMTSYLGYFTDNGAFYYYNPLKDQKYDTTLITVKKHADEIQIPYQYYHLDSWWYQKSVQAWKRTLLGRLGRLIGGGLYGGTLLWEPDPEAFNMSIDDFYQKLDQKAFTAHNRWYAPNSPYLQQFHFITEGQKAMPDDPKFWDHIMQTAKKYHIKVYEQDWMKNQISAFSHLRNEMGTAQRWLSQMATAAQEQEITIQYCMATPAMWMSAIQFPAVSNVRGSGDYAPRWPHIYDVPYFMQTSMMAWALNLSPFKDTFESTRRGRINGERCPELMCLVSALSSGPVAPGDEIGFMDVSSIKATCRKDGLLYKADRPMTPVDLTYIKNSNYYICSTESKQGELNWYYVLTMNFWPHRVKNRMYSLSQLDIQGRFVEYNWYTQKIRKVDDTTDIQLKLKFEEYVYCLYAPIFLNGYAILGDPTKYVCMNDKTFSNIQETRQGLTLDVTSITGETVECLIFAEKEPLEIQMEKQTVPKLISRNSNLPVSYTYDETEHLLRIVIQYAANETKLVKTLQIKSV